MENPPFEDVFPIQDGDFPLLCLFTGGYKQFYTPGMNNKSLVVWGLFVGDTTCTMNRWFQRFFGIFTRILGEKIPNFTNIFQMG